MSRVYPQWFIDKLYNEEDKKRAIDGSLSSHDKVEFYCEKHGSYYVFVGDLIKLSTGEPKRSGRCRKCVLEKQGVKISESRKSSRPSYPQWFIDDLFSDLDKDRAISRELATNDRVYFKCDKHGKYLQRVSDHIKLSTGERKCGCRECKYEENGKSIRIRYDKNRGNYPWWFIESLLNDEDKEKARFGLLRTTDIVMFNCPTHGEYKKLVGNRINLSTGEEGEGCPVCGKESGIKNRVVTVKEKWIIPQWLIDSVSEGDKRNLEDRNCTYDTKLTLTCNEHGEYQRRLGDCIYLKTGERKNPYCPKCNYYKGLENRLKKLSERRRYPQWFVDELVDEETKQLAITGQLSGNEYVRMVCSNGHETYRRVNSRVHIKTGEEYEGCPRCLFGSQRSKLEDVIISYLPNVRIECNVKGIIKNPETGNWYELDIYLPDYKIAIEVNGSYYHASIGPEIENTYYKSKTYHQDKFKLCEEKGIRLISIYDVYWYSRRNKIVDIIRASIGNYKEVIFARKCNVEKISVNLGGCFCRQNHVSEKGMGSEYYGLYLKERLVSVLSIMSPRFGQNYDYEIGRFCSLQGVKVVGGFQKLLSHIKREKGPISLFTYSDNNYFTGNVYNRSGFRFIGYTKPGYYWTKNGYDIINRQECESRRLKDLYPELCENVKGGSIEDYVMTTLGYYKVYTCGNKKWVLE